MRPRLLAVPLSLCFVVAAPAVAPAAPPAAAVAKKATKRPQARAAVVKEVAGAFASRLATAGAPYLIDHLKAGALGDTGRSIGNLLGDSGLAEPTPTQVLGEIQGLRRQVDALSQQVNGVSVQLDRLGAAVADANYSNLVAQASSIRGAVIRGETLLRQIAESAPSERDRLADELVTLYDRDLRGKEETLELYLVGGAAGADGILQAASKRARSAAQPFATHAMTQFARDVYNDYALVQAAMLTIRLNVLHREEAPVSYMNHAITQTEEAIKRQFRVLPPYVVFEGMVLDTRTSQLWSWKVDATPCQDLTTNGAINGCIYARSQEASRSTYDLPAGSHWTSAASSNGIRHPRRPFLGEVLALRTGASGSGPRWMHERGGFPASMSDVWTLAVNGNQAQVVTMGSGAVSIQPRSNRYYRLMVESFPETLSNYFVGG